LRRRWLGGSLALALAALQLFSPAVAIAQDVEVPAEPAVVETATDAAVDPAAVAATIWYVDGSSGSDGGGCNSAGSPCRTIQSAVDRAASGDTILVAGSANGIVYTFGGANDCTNDLGANAVVCVANKRLVMRGGFASGNFGSYAPAQNLTIIDGQGQHRGVAAQGYGNAGGTVLDMAGFTVRNSYGTLISKRSAPGADFAFGGGMRVESIGSLTLRDMVFDGNRVVGADRGGSDPGGTGGGGALYIGGATASLQNVRFTNNSAQGGASVARGGYGQGGALLATDATLTAGGVLFQNNVARAGNASGAGDAGGQRADAHGGGAAFYNGSTVTLNDVTARTNQAYGGKAATHAGGAFGGGLYAEGAQITVNGADILANVAQGGDAQNGYMGSGGGIMVIHSTLNVNRARILANVAQGGNGTSGQWGGPNGGGITVSASQGTGSNFTLANSVVAANKALRGQGAQTLGGGGGGLWIQAAEATIDHSTIADNQLGGGPGLFGQGVLQIETGSRASNVIYRNSLITGHSGDGGSAVDVLSKNTATFAGGLFFNNKWNTSQGNPNLGQNIGTINGLNTMGNADPLYVSPGASSYDYHIQASSPARNKAAGSQQNLDIDNESRSDGSPDYGADEYVNSDPQGLPPGRILLFMPRIGR
jgi:hypothetical protein